MAALKIAGGLSLIGAVVAEFVAGATGTNTGLASRIIESSFRNEIPKMFAALVAGVADGCGHLPDDVSGLQASCWEGGTKARSNVRLDRVTLGGRTVALEIEDGRIARIEPVHGPAVWQVLPRPVDPHVHLDKTFLWPRAKPPAPGLFPAIEATLADRADWTAEDIRARAGRALAEASAAGTRALRTHVDWNEPGVPLAWDVLGEMAADAPLHIQRAPLVPLDLLGDANLGPPIAAHVAATVRRRPWQLHLSQRRPCREAGARL